MVDLDHLLIFRARRLANGANIHRLKNMIFAYEQAVLLHNKGWPTHRIYHQRCEQELRKFVAQANERSRRILPSITR
jgi:molybdopterin-guanine dinucleotide biosynthesis protein A